MHLILGLILIIWVIITLFFAIKAGKAYKKFAVLGFIFVLVAFVAGIATVMLKESQAEFASLVMSLGFIISLILYQKLYGLIRK